MAAGRELAASLQESRARFDEADAFDPASIEAVEPRPNIAIVSGLYELFPDNGRVGASLQAVADVLEPGGTLIYTGQPWHPQVEMIARTCDNRDGDPWIMRCRSQVEMDQLAADAGFRKIAMETDEHGIFTVSLAQKVGGPPERPDVV